MFRARFDTEPLPVADEELDRAPKGSGLRGDLLAFYEQDDALADLVIHLNEGAVMAHRAIVAARLPSLLSSAEALQEQDPALLDDRGRSGHRERDLSPVGK